MIQHIQVSAGHLLRPQPGDLLVFTTERYMRREDAERFAALMQAHLPGVKAIMLDGGVQLARIHTHAEIQRLLAQLPVSDQQTAEPAPQPFDLDTACQQAMARISAYIDERTKWAHDSHRFATSCRLVARSQRWRRL